MAVGRGAPCKVSSEGLSGLTPLDEAADACAQEKSMDVTA